MAQNTLALELVNEQKVGRTSETSWVVVSNATYRVRKLPEGFFCERIRPHSFKICKGWQFCRGKRALKTCKHVEAVKYFEVKSQG